MHPIASSVRLHSFNLLNIHISNIIRYRTLSSDWVEWNASNSYLSNQLPHRKILKMVIFISLNNFLKFNFLHKYFFCKLLRKGYIPKKTFLGAIFSRWQHERREYAVAKLKFKKSIPKKNMKITFGIRNNSYVADLCYRCLFNFSINEYWSRWCKVPIGWLIDLGSYIILKKIV